MKKPFTHLLSCLILTSICCISFFKLPAQTQNCIDPSLINPNAFCITLYSPVCGCDGVTYSNSCEAQNYNGVTSYTPGACAQRCDATFSSTPDPSGFGVQFYSNQLTPTGAHSGTLWDFGDGNTSHLPNPHHIYGAAGSYIVCLTVTGWVGNTQCTAIHCDTIVVGASNSCIDPSLINTNQPCPAIYDPVCGCDGNQYSNSCVAQYHHGVTSFSPGSCGGHPCQAHYTYTPVPNHNLGIQFTNQTMPASAYSFTSAWDFGDGTTSAQDNPLHIFSAPGTYYVCLTTTYQVSQMGPVCTDTFCDTVRVGQNICVDPSVIDLNLACIMIYDPVCGCDGQTYSNSCVAYTHHGVTQWTPGACTATCQASFTYSVDSNGVGVQFTNTSMPNTLGGAISVSWDFGDGHASTVKNPFHSYNAPGTYLVCMTISVTTAAGNICTDTYCASVVIGQNACVDHSLIDLSQPCPFIYAPVCGCDGNTYGNSCVATYHHGITSYTQGGCQPGCQASFTHSQTSFNTGVQFTNTSFPNLPAMPFYTSSWDFGDGANSTDNNPYHVFPAAGVYYVCLTVTMPNSNGTTCTDTYCDSVRVGHVPPPNCQADFNYSYGIVAPGVFFFDNSTGNPTNWHWDFGDGTSSTQQNPFHIFPTTGSYTVCLTIVSATNSGAFCTSTYCDTVLAPGCINPSAIDTTVICPTVFDPVCGCDSVTYGNSCIAQKYHGVTSWRPGPCQNTGGCQAYFTYNTGFIGPTIFFTDRSSGNPTLWHWDFGDGATSNLRNPSHTFLNPGRYAVCLTVSGSNAFCYDTYCDTIVIPGCVDSSLIDPNAICPAIYAPVCGCDSVTYSNSCVAQSQGGVTSWKQGPCNPPCNASFSWAHCIDCPVVFFTNTSTGNYRQKWDFGDGEISIKKDPQHTYATSGTYYVCLSIWNNFTNCYDTYCDSVVASGCVDSSLINNQPCPMIYNPVCGCDGKTYMNSCVAQNRAGIVPWFTTPGPCPGSGYCPSQGMDNGRAWIQRVGPNISGDDGGYGYFNYCHRTFQSGNTYILRVRGRVNNPPPGTQAHWRLWIDFNHDNDFDDPGELVWQAYGGLNHNAVFTIPNYACGGCTRMRIQLSDQFNDPCGPYSMGETEDYDVTIKSNAFCQNIHVNNFSGIPLSNRKTDAGELFAEIYEPVSFRIYPNPADDYANISLTLTDDVQRVEVQVIDISGKEVINLNVNNLSNNSLVQVPTGELANGLYQVIINTNHGFRKIEKLVITR